MAREHLVARLDATLGAIRGISEGVAVQRERGAVQFVQFVQLLCSQQMASLRQLLGLLHKLHSVFIKRYLLDI